MNILDCAFQFADIMIMGTVLQKATHHLDALFYCNVRLILVVNGSDADLKVTLPLCLTIRYRFLRFGPLISLYSIPSCNCAYKFRCPVGVYIMNPNSSEYAMYLPFCTADDDSKLFDEHMRCQAHNFDLNWSSSSHWYRLQNNSLGCFHPVIIRI